MYTPDLSLVAANFWRAMSSLTTASSMEESLEEFDTRLSLGIGGGGDGRRPPRRRPPPVQFDELFPPPRAVPLEDHHGSRHRDHAPSRKKGSEGGAASTRQKKARTMHGPDDGRERRNPSGGGDAGGARKKLRLTGEQAALLEDNFRAHEILSHAQKHDLARQLSLSPRQVEVWFQNRRARTKLKQTEVDCELLRQWCERLSDENARLRHELAEARSSAVSRLTSAAVLCPSCDKLALVGGGDMAA